MRTSLRFTSTTTAVVGGGAGGSSGMFHASPLLLQHRTSSGGGSTGNGENNSNTTATRSVTQDTLNHNQAKQQEPRQGGVGGGGGGGNQPQRPLAPGQKFFIKNHGNVNPKEKHHYQAPNSIGGELHPLLLKEKRRGLSKEQQALVDAINAKSDKQQQMTRDLQHSLSSSPYSTASIDTDGGSATQSSSQSDVVGSITSASSASASLLPADQHAIIALLATRCFSAKDGALTNVLQQLCEEFSGTAAAHAVVSEGKTNKRGKRGDNDESGVDHNVTGDVSSSFSIRAKVMALKSQYGSTATSAKSMNHLKQIVRPLSIVKSIAAVYEGAEPVAIHGVDITAATAALASSSPSSALSSSSSSSAIAQLSPTFKHSTPLQQHKALLVVSQWTREQLHSLTAIVGAHARGEVLYYPASAARLPFALPLFVADRSLVPKDAAKSFLTAASANAEVTRIVLENIQDLLEISAILEKSPHLVPIFPPEEKKRFNAALSSGFSKLSATFLEYTSDNAIYLDSFHRKLHVDANADDVADRELAASQLHVAHANNPVFSHQQQQNNGNSSRSSNSKYELKTSSLTMGSSTTDFLGGGVGGGSNKGRVASEAAAAAEEAARRKKFRPHDEMLELFFNTLGSATIVNALFASTLTTNVQLYRFLTSAILSGCGMKNTKLTHESFVRIVETLLKNGIPPNVLLASPTVASMSPEMGIAFVSIITDHCCRHSSRFLIPVSDALDAEMVAIQKETKLQQSSGNNKGVARDVSVSSATAAASSKTTSILMLPAICIETLSLFRRELAAKQQTTRSLADIRHIALKQRLKLMADLILHGHSAEAVVLARTHVLEMRYFITERSNTLSQVPIAEYCIEALQSVKAIAEVIGGYMTLVKRSCGLPGSENSHLFGFTDNLANSAKLSSSSSVSSKNSEKGDSEAVRILSQSEIAAAFLRLDAVQSRVRDGLAEVTAVYTSFVHDTHAKLLMQARSSVADAYNINRESGSGSGNGNDSRSSSSSPSASPPPAFPTSSSLFSKHSRTVTTKGLNINQMTAMNYSGDISAQNVIGTRSTVRDQLEEIAKGIRAAVGDIVGIIVSANLSNASLAQLRPLLVHSLQMLGADIQEAQKGLRGDDEDDFAKKGGRGGGKPMVTTAASSSSDIITQMLRMCLLTSDHLLSRDATMMRSASAFSKSSSSSHASSSPFTQIANADCQVQIKSSPLIAEWLNGAMHFFMEDVRKRMIDLTLWTPTPEGSSRVLCTADQLRSINMYYPFSPRQAARNFISDLIANGLFKAYFHVTASSATGTGSTSITQLFVSDFAAGDQTRMLFGLSDTSKMGQMQMRNAANRASSSPSRFGQEDDQDGNIVTNRVYGRSEGNRGDDQDGKSSGGGGGMFAVNPAALARRQNLKDREAEWDALRRYCISSALSPEEVFMIVTSLSRLEAMLPAEGEHELIQRFKKILLPVYLHFASSASEPAALLSSATASSHGEPVLEVKALSSSDVSAKKKARNATAKKTDSDNNNQSQQNAAGIPTDPSDVSTYVRALTHRALVLSDGLKTFSLVAQRLEVVVPNNRQTGDEIPPSGDESSSSFEKKKCKTDKRKNLSPKEFSYVEEPPDTVMATTMRPATDVLLERTCRVALEGVLRPCIALLKRSEAAIDRAKLNPPKPAIGRPRKHNKPDVIVGAEEDVPISISPEDLRMLTSIVGELLKTLAVMGEAKALRDAVMLSSKKDVTGVDEQRPTLEKSSFSSSSSSPSPSQWSAELEEALRLFTSPLFRDSSSSPSPPSPFSENGSDESSSSASNVFTSTAVHSPFFISAGDQLQFSLGLRKATGGRFDHITNISGLVHVVCDEACRSTHLLPNAMKLLAQKKQRRQSLSSDDANVADTELDATDASNPITGEDNKNDNTPRKWAHHKNVKEWSWDDRFAIIASVTDLLTASPSSSGVPATAAPTSSGASPQQQTVPIPASSESLLQASGGSVVVADDGAASSTASGHAVEFTNRSLLIDLYTLIKSSPALLYYTDRVRTIATKIPTIGGGGGGKSASGDKPSSKKLLPTSTGLPLPPSFEEYANDTTNSIPNKPRDWELTEGAEEVRIEQARRQQRRLEKKRQEAAAAAASGDGDNDLPSTRGDFDNNDADDDEYDSIFPKATIEAREAAVLLRGLYAIYCEAVKMEAEADVSNMIEMEAKKAAEEEAKAEKEEADPNSSNQNAPKKRKPFDSVSRQLVFYTGSRTPSFFRKRQTLPPAMSVLRQMEEICQIVFRNRANISPADVAVMCDAIANAFPSNIRNLKITSSSVDNVLHHARSIFGKAKFLDELGGKAFADEANIALSIRDKLNDEALVGSEASNTTSSQLSSMGNASKKYATKVHDLSIDSNSIASKISSETAALLSATAAGSFISRTSSTFSKNRLNRYAVASQANAPMGIRKILKAQMLATAAAEETRSRHLSMFIPSIIAHRASLSPRDCVMCLRALVLTNIQHATCYGVIFQRMAELNSAFDVDAVVDLVGCAHLAKANNNEALQKTCHQSAQPIIRQVIFGIIANNAEVLLTDVGRRIMFAVAAACPNDAVSDQIIVAFANLLRVSEPRIETFRCVLELTRCKQLPDVQAVDTIRKYLLRTVLAPAPSHFAAAASSVFGSSVDQRSMLASMSRTGVSLSSSSPSSSSSSSSARQKGTSSSNYDVNDVIGVANLLVDVGARDDDLFSQLKVIVIDRADEVKIEGIVDLSKLISKSRHDDTEMMEVVLRYFFLAGPAQSDAKRRRDLERKSVASATSDLHSFSALLDGSFAVSSGGGGGGGGGGISAEELARLSALAASIPASDLAHLLATAHVIFDKKQHQSAAAASASSPPALSMCESMAMAKSQRVSAATLVLGEIASKRRQALSPLGSTASTTMMPASGLSSTELKIFSNIVSAILPILSRKINTLPITDLRIVISSLTGLGSIKKATCNTNAEKEKHATTEALAKHQDTPVIEVKSKKIDKKKKSATTSAAIVADVAPANVEEVKVSNKLAASAVDVESPTRQQDEQERTTTTTTAQSAAIDFVTKAIVRIGTERLESLDVSAAVLLLAPLMELRVGFDTLSLLEEMKARGEKLAAKEKEGGELSGSDDGSSSSPLPKVSDEAIEQLLAITRLMDYVYLTRRIVSSRQTMMQKLRRAFALCPEAKRMHPALHDFVFSEKEHP